ncbi:hypothetical protein ACFXGR_54985 [Streptomyces mirabilis]|uniref:hypothetical protein n=1 Tax=Streptomyces mirabilis TaxID=68239 RepID=UPI003682876F
MTDSIAFTELQKVNTIKHVEATTVVPPIDAQHPEGRQQLHVYTGWLDVNTQSHDLFRQQIVSYVPTAPLIVQTVPTRGLLLGKTVTASPASVALDEANTIFAVDSASVALEPQKPFQGAEGAPFCLILRMNVAIQRGSLLRITYQVTALWSDVTIALTPEQPGTGAPTPQHDDP